MSRRQLGAALIAVVDERREPVLPTDQVAFVQLLASHGIAGIGWRRTGHLTWGDPAVRATLRAARTEAAHRHIIAVSTLTRVADLLDGAGIDWVTFKGPVMAEHLHREASDRSYTDVDVLVRARDLAVAVETLEAAGFDLLDQNWDLLNRRLLGELHLLSPDGMPVDLHWSLINRPEIRARFDFDTADVLAARREVDLGGRPVSTLSPTDTAVHAATHAALSGGHRLLWCLDVASATDPALVDARDVAARAKQVRAGGAMAAMVARSAETTGAQRSQLLDALGHHLLARSSTRWGPRWQEPDRGGPARWLMRAAGPGGISSVAPLTREVASAVRRSTRTGRGSAAGWYTSVFAAGGERRDRERFMAAVARHERRRPSGRGSTT